MHPWNGKYFYTNILHTYFFIILLRSTNLPTSPPLSPVNNNSSSQLPPTCTTKPSSSSSSINSQIDDSPAKKKVLSNLHKLMTSCVVLRIEDFTLYRVTTSGKKQMPKEFISGKNFCHNKIYNQIVI